MYIPGYFELEDREWCFDLIRDNSFAQLITIDDKNIPFVTFLPFMVDAQRGPSGSLIGHMARGNPQWRHFREGQLVLASFMGPHRYLSPKAYRSQQAVPTWIYIAVQAYGFPRIIEDDSRVDEIMRDLVAQQESGISDPWRIESQSEEYLARMRKGIVAFEIEIERLEGKAKLNQNKSEGDITGTYQSLLTSSDPSARQLAQMMQKLGLVKEEVE